MACILNENAYHLQTMDERRLSAIKDKGRQRPSERAAPVPAGGTELESGALLGERREIVIRHGAERYRLRLTRLNKLILTK